MAVKCKLIGVKRNEYGAAVGQILVPQNVFLV